MSIRLFFSGSVRSQRGCVRVAIMIFPDFINCHTSNFYVSNFIPWFLSECLKIKKAYEKFTDSALYWIGAGGITIGTAVVADKLDAQQDFSHRY